MVKPFVPDDFVIPLEFSAQHFRLEPLGAQHNERDHEAWMASIEHIKSTPGYVGEKWPFEMSLAKNLLDLERHVNDFTLRQGFTYSVLDGDEIIGCVYLYPDKKDIFDVQVKSWVIAGRANLDYTLWETVSSWLEDAWPFDSVQYESR